MKAKYFAYLCTAILLLICGLDTSWGYCSGARLANHFAFHFAHASVWHLAGNVLCFYVLTRYRLDWAEFIGAYAIATACSFIAPHELPTVGLSGLIYALYGMRLTRCRNLSYGFFIRTAFILFLPLITGGVNVWLHLSCITIGYGSLLLFSNLKQTIKDVKRCDR